MSLCFGRNKRSMHAVFTSSCLIFLFNEKKGIEVCVVNAMY